jgi:phage tail-like protein
MSFDVKTVREGGNNGTAVRLAGAASYGQLTLKRGMTASSADLWRWFQQVLADPAVRATGEVVVHSPDHATDDACFVLRRCLPVKIKAPPLNGKDGVVAVEEMQLAYESLSLLPPGGGQP